MYVVGVVNDQLQLGAALLLHWKGTKGERRVEITNMRCGWLINQLVNLKSFNVSIQTKPPRGHAENNQEERSMGRYPTFTQPDSVVIYRGVGGRGGESLLPSE